MQPTEIMTDFEAGMRKAIRSVFPEAVLRGCYFHFKKAVRTKCDKLMLRSLIKSNEHAASIVAKLQNLPLTPPNQTKKAYNLIKKQAKKVGLHKEMAQLFTYFERFWVVKVLTQLSNILINIKFQNCLSIFLE